MENFRVQFPVLKEWAYFGWASVAPLSSPAVAAMQAQAEGVRDGGVTRYAEWYQCFDQVRALAAKLLSAEKAAVESKEIALLKNTSEGVNTIAQGLDWKPGDNLLLPLSEFPSNAYPWLALKARGVEIRRVPVDEWGRYTVAEVERLADARTRLLAVSAVNFATGFRPDLHALGKFCAERKIFFFVDAIQGLGVFPLHPRQLQIDALCADGHKWLCGPEGLALFYLNAEHFERVRPLSLGWWSVDRPGAYERDDQALASTARRYECGTLPTANAYGLRAALELIQNAGLNNITARVLELSAQARQLLNETPAQLHLPPGTKNWESQIFSFEVPGREAKALARALELKRVLVNPRNGRLRVAVHAWNAIEDMQRLANALAGG